MSNKKGFTLAEALLTLTIIGVIAVLTIPSVIHNYKEAQYKLGAKKAVKALNEAISLNIAMGRKSPLRTTEDNNLFEYLQQAMSVVRSTTRLQYNKNAMAFYTKDGMRYEFPSSHGEDTGVDTYDGQIKSGDLDGEQYEYMDYSVNGKLYNCGSKGVMTTGSAEALNTNPCFVMVDVNGDKKPNPSTYSTNERTYQIYTGGEAAELNDLFIIMITDTSAIPYGELAQSVVYN